MGEFIYGLKQKVSNSKYTLFFKLTTLLHKFQLSWVLPMHCQEEILCLYLQLLSDSSR